MKAINFVLSAVIYLLCYGFMSGMFLIIATGAYGSRAGLIDWIVYLVMSVFAYFTSFNIANKFNKWYNSKLK